MNDQEKARRNDEVRTTGEFLTQGRSHLVLTPSVEDLGEEALHFLIEKLITFNEFTEDVDLPNGVRDFGVLRWDGRDVWFQIDLSDEGEDYRVVTLLLPEDY